MCSWKLEQTIEGIPAVFECDLDETKYNAEKKNPPPSEMLQVVWRKQNKERTVHGAVFRKREAANRWKRGRRRPCGGCRDGDALGMIQVFDLNRLLLDSILKLQRSDSRPWCALTHVVKQPRVSLKTRLSPKHFMSLRKEKKTHLKEQNLLKKRKKKNRLGSLALRLSGVQPHRVVWPTCSSSSAILVFV
jgi:hypothetical protein